MKKYLHLTKPGIVVGNLIAALAGFGLAAKGNWEWSLLAFLLLGLGCIVASACVFNNCLDQNLDKKMERTKNRPLVTDEIALPSAIFFGIALGFLGIYLLSHFVGLLPLVLSLLGLMGYIFLYTPLKYLTPHATWLGSLPGAIPPVVGYSAVAQTLDGAALCLFCLLVCWQMPHFFAIALYRKEEYKKGGIPVLPLVKGEYRTKLWMIAYALGFCALVPCLSFWGANPFAVGGIFLLAALWALRTIQGLWHPSVETWAKGVFRHSLQTMMGTALLLWV